MFVKKDLALFRYFFRTASITITSIFIGSSSNSGTHHHGLGGNEGIAEGSGEISGGGFGGSYGGGKGGGLVLEEGKDGLATGSK